MYKHYFSLLFMVTASMGMFGQDIVESDSISNVLSEVEIVAQRKLIKSSPGRIEYDVSGDKDARSMSVMELLRKIPMVTVDENDNILVDGSSDFLIYQNGKPSGLYAKNPKNALNSTPAELVKRIEVITDPDAQYDAEGVNGIINIVMDERSVIDGVLGIVRTVAMTSEVYSASADVTTQKGPITINANYGYNWYGKTQTTQSEYNYLYKESGNRLLSRDEDYMPGSVQLFGLSASYEIDSLNLLSMSFNTQFMRFKYDMTGFSDIISSDGNTLYSYNNQYCIPPYNNIDLTVRTDFEHRTQLKGEVLSVSYLMNISKSKVSGTMDYFDGDTNNPLPESSYESITKSKSLEHTIQLDYVRPLFNGSHINVGSKYILRENPLYEKNEYDDGHLYMSDFKHYSHIAALYGEFSIERRRWQAQAGLRYEFSRLGGKFYDDVTADFYRDLNDVVPSVGVGMKINDANNLSLNYNVRIKRPTISRLNPAVSESPLFESKGNPNLVSANQHNISMRYMYNSQHFMLNATLRHTIIDDSFVAIKTVLDGVICSTYENMGRYQMTSLQGYAQWTPTRSTSLTLNYGIYYQTAENLAMNISLNRWKFSFVGLLSQQLPWKLRLTLGVVKGPGAEITPYAYQDGRYSYNVGVQRSFLDGERLTAKIMVTNLFCRKYQGSPTHIVNGDYIGTAITRYISNPVQLSVTYRFGSLDTKIKKVNKTIENDDLM